MLALPAAGGYIATNADVIAAAINATAAAAIARTDTVIVVQSADLGRP